MRSIGIRLTNGFVLSVGALLILTGLAKLASIFGNEHAFIIRDPLFRIPYKILFISAGLIELAIALVCFARMNVKIKLQLVGWLTCSLISYRVYLFSTGHRLPCDCLGVVTTMLHLERNHVDFAMRVALGYMAVGCILSCIATMRDAQGRVSATSTGLLPTHASF